MWISVLCALFFWFIISLHSAPIPLPAPSEQKDMKSKNKSQNKIKLLCDPSARTASRGRKSPLEENLRLWLQQCLRFHFLRWEINGIWIYDSFLTIVTSSDRARFPSPSWHKKYEFSHSPPSCPRPLLAGKAYLKSSRTTQRLLERNGFCRMLETDWRETHKTTRKSIR